MVRRAQDWISTADAAEMLTGNPRDYQVVMYAWKTGKLTQRWRKSPRKLFYLRTEVEKLKRAA